MKEKIIYALIIALLGGIIGWLLCGYFNKSDIPAIPKTPEIQVIGPVAPDTVFQIDAEKARELRLAYRKIRDLQGTVKYLKDNPEIVVKEVPRKEKNLDDLPLFESMKSFEFKNLGLDQEGKPFVFGSVLAYSPMPVEAFETSMTVRWADYFDLNYKPTYESKIVSVRKNSILKGLTAGIVATGAIAAGFALDNPYIAIGGLAGGSFIILYF